MPHLPIHWPDPLTREAVAAIMDHTLLKASATRADILRVANEGLEHKVASVCVNPLWVTTVHEVLKDSEVAVCSVVGFPLGASRKELVAMEATRAIHDGAAEIDMVMPVGAALEGEWGIAGEHVAAVRKAIGEHTLKVILEVCELNDAQVVEASRTAMDAGADFIKTSTGFGGGGATVRAVELMADIARGRAGIKAAGGIKTLADVQTMVTAGATRIGASATLAILNELN